ncbi:MAG TPA: enolase C-terminal domain-like protein [Candidatus Obscuribacter sp.]|nr:enolase C-terminal domain-like protein [Candidatus Obscuribacter sp.]HNG72862.1 enolase C-terminal domain-like protein [Candidatus Obscuribacter sp.]
MDTGSDSRGHLMQIKSIVSRPVRLPFRFSFGHSLASRNFSRNIVVEVAIAVGEGTVTGLGESVPREYVTGETSESALAFINEVLAPALLGRSFAGVDQLLGALEALFYQERLDERPLGAAFCAVELALLDACARILGLPFYLMPAYLARLSRLPAAASTLDRTLWNLELPWSERVFRYGGGVPFGKRKVLEALLRAYKAYGFQTVKLKVGDDIDEDLVKIKLARSILGPAVKLRIDANCAWNFDLACLAMERFRPLGVVSLEQPLPRLETEGLARLQARLPETIVVDESLTTLKEAQRLIELKACRAFNIRISKVGGIVAAMKLVELARQASLECHLGAQVGESGILASAQKHLALAVPDLFANVEGAMNLFLLKRDLTRECLTVPFGAVVSARPPERANLGLAVNLKRESLLKLMEA